MWEHGILIGIEFLPNTCFIDYRCLRDAGLWHANCVQYVGMAWVECKVLNVQKEGHIVSQTNQSEWAVRLGKLLKFHYPRHEPRRQMADAEKLPLWGFATSWFTNFLLSILLPLPMSGCLLNLSYLASIAHTASGSPHSTNFCSQNMQISADFLPRAM